MIEVSQAEELFTKCKLSEITNSDLIGSFLVQLAFLVFGFKKNRRIFVNCAESMFGYLKDLVSDRIVATTQKQNHPQIVQNIKYEHLLANNIKAKDLENPFFDCFEILDKIVKDVLGFNLIQPISKQFNEFRAQNQQSE